MSRLISCILLCISLMPLFSCSNDSAATEEEQNTVVTPTLRSGDKLTNETHHARRDLKMVAFIGIMLMYLIPLTWLVERLVKHKNKKIKVLNSEKTDLETQKNSLAEEVAAEQNQNILLNDELRKLRLNYDQLHQIKKSENKTLKQLLQRIDAYSARLYLTPKATAGMDLRSDKFLREIDDMIDGYSNGFIAAVKLSFPKMKPQRLRLVRYLYAGFSTETMMYLFDYENRAKLDNGKWLLKRSILENSNWHNLDSNTMLSKLNYKI